MRAHLRAIIESLKKHAVGWAVTAVLAPGLTIMLAIEEQIMSWLSQFPATWGYRVWLATIVAYWWLWIRWEWNRPRLRLDPESTTYIDIKTGNRYCPKCRKEGHLRNVARGWTCVACDKFFPDPKRKPEPKPPTDRGPHGWMR